MLWKLPFAVTSLSLATPKHDCQPPVKTITLDDFHKWADENKIIRSVEIRQEPGVGGGKGLVATRNLLPHEVALQVPRTLTIKTRGEAYDGDWAGSMASQLCQLQDDVAVEPIDVGFEYEFAAGQSYSWKPFSWKPYLEFGLPSDQPYTSSQWTESQLKELQNETFVEECRSTAQWAETQYQRFAADRSRDEFDRALTLVCSRTLEAGTGARMLVPFLDNANHAVLADGGGHFHVGSGAITLFVGDKGVKKGDPVTLDYGPRTADEYAVHYGFVPEKCVGDTVLIPGLCSVVSWANSESPDGHADPAVRLRCSEMLDAYPTSLAEDEDLVRSYLGGFDAYRVALSYRISKKSLLSKAAGRE
jgi:hypothetical protein